jgi:hypothetical protein
LQTLKGEIIKPQNAGHRAFFGARLSAGQQVNTITVGRYTKLELDLLPVSRSKIKRPRRRDDSVQLCISNLDERQASSTKILGSDPK